MFTYSTKFSTLLMKKPNQVGYIFVQVIYNSSFQLIIDSSSVILNWKRVLPALKQN